MAESEDRARTGVHGLDELLGGGVPRDRLYLLDGLPGTGKTTLALQFLIEGAARGERGLYVTLSETAVELRAAADSHGWSLDGIHIVELSAVQDVNAEEAYTLFHPAEVELQHTVELVLAEVERLQPMRVVFDSLSEMRMLARDALRFRRQILALKQFFAGRSCTVLLLDDHSHPEGELQLQSLAHGVLMLEHLPMDYGAERRRLTVVKLRGVRFRGGYHDFRITTGGIEVYPRILRNGKGQSAPARVVSSGSPELDQLLGGGIMTGTSTLITGAAGTGKSVLAMKYAMAAAGRGERVLVYLFDERVQTALARARGLGIDPSQAMEGGLLTLRQVEPTEMSPGEFAQSIVRAVEEEGATMVVIDSLSGYMQAMPEERLLSIQVYELLSYLANHGVTSLMTLVQHGLFTGPVQSDIDLSYLADTVVLLRYFEHGGAVHQSISVVKKRYGHHERTIREYLIDHGGLRVGEPLTEFRGVLTGVPQYTGGSGPLLPSTADARTASS